MELSPNNEATGTENNDISSYKSSNLSNNNNTEATTVYNLNQQQYNIQNISNTIQEQKDLYNNNQIPTFNSTNINVGSLSISPASRDVVLAGRQGLVIIDLENPWLIPRILPHMSKWEVADVQWSPYVSREAWVASTSNQKLLIWNLNSSSQVIEHTIHAHARAISDINWSPHHPDIVATCSVDTYVCVWDLRCAGNSHQRREDDLYYRPANSFTPWNAAATQVKFNFKNEYLVASAHDKDVKIWDMRKGAVPMTSITAHSKKIYGIDWSRQNDHDIVTCSLDKLVKYWNIHSPEKEEETITTNSPVWRARNTPFGNGVLTMPQRSESTLYLYNRATPDKPVHLFEGHTDTVKEFVWRWKGGQANDADDREFQLVTWSKDQNLRLWPVSEDIMKSVGHCPSSKKTCYRVPSKALGSNGTYHSHSFQETPIEDEKTDERSLSVAAAIAPIKLIPSNTSAFNGSIGNYSTGYNFTSNAYREQKYTINPLLWMQNVKTITPNNDLKKNTSSENTYQSLAEELSSVLNKYASVGVKTEKVDAAARTCTISLHGQWFESGTTFLRITIRFGQQYPDNSPPEFDIQKNSMISIYYRTHIAQDLNALASSYTSQNRWCLEPCIRYLLGETMQEEESHFRSGVSSNTVVPNNTKLDTTNLNEHDQYEDESTGSATFNDTGMNKDSPNQSNTNYVGNWNSTAVGEADSDDEIFVGPSFMGGYGMTNGKRGSLQSEKGIILDLSSKQSVDEKVPFPRLCGGVFSGSGQLVCFFSTLRDPKKGANRNDNKSKQDVSSSSNTNSGEYFENTYQDFYKHPKSYEQFEEYKEIAAMSRQGRNATVVVNGSGTFGEYTYDDDPDDIDDGLANMASIYFKPDGMALDSSIKPDDSLLYHGSKSDQITHNITIFDCSDIMPFDPWLAKEFILSTCSPAEACKHNAKVASVHDREDLAQIWKICMEVLRECVPLEITDLNLIEELLNKQHDLLSQPTNSTSSKNNRRRSDTSSPLGKQATNKTTAESNDYKDEKTGYNYRDATIKLLNELPKQQVRWGSHPLGQKLVDNVLQHFIRIGDIQMAALLSCLFQDIQIPIHKPSRHEIRKLKSWNSKDYILSSTSGDLLYKPTNVDYFSIKKTRQNIHRTNSGPNLNSNPNVPNRNNSQLQLSQSYGTKGTNFLSYFWDNNDRRTSPSSEKQALMDTPSEIAEPLANSNSNNLANRVTNRPQSWMTTYSGVKIPSNTAPGVRTVAGSQGSNHSYMSAPSGLVSPHIVNFPNFTLFPTSGTSVPLPSPSIVPCQPFIVANKEGTVLQCDDLSIQFNNMEWFDSEKEFVYNQIPLISPKKTGQYDVARMNYADLLYRLDLWERRAEVLKCVNPKNNISSSSSFSSQYHIKSKEKTMEVQVNCHMCDSQVIGTERMCYQCRKIRTQVSCSICHQLVKGLVNFCINCKHGGHSKHIKEWFNEHDVCPTGCGCHCLIETKDYGILS
ncbi:unnamed protein product [Cunninghamella echinulata]